MKRVLVIVATIAMLVAVGAGAQNIQEGDIIIGGSSADLFNFSHREEAPGGNFDELSISVDTVFIRLNTYAGFFLSDGFEIGPEVILEYRREKSAALVDSDTDLGLGAQFGYFHDTGGPVVPYFRFAGAFISTTFERNGNDSGETGYSITPRAGIIYFLTEEAGINVNAYFNYLRAVDVDPDLDLEAREIEFGLELGVTLAL
jgi:hypothetical protein